MKLHYLRVLKAVYGLSNAPRIFYQDFKKSPESFVEEKLDDHFFNVSMVLQDQELGRLYYGMTQQKAKKIDAAMTDSIRNKLFR